MLTTSLSWSDRLQVASGCFLILRGSLTGGPLQRRSIRPRSRMALFRSLRMRMAAAGFLAPEQIGAYLHVNEVSVRTERQRHGIGCRLMEAARS